MPDGKAAAFRIVDRAPAAKGDERGRVVAKLLATPAAIEPKYFYDELGCAIYGAICRLPEYYPTRTERALFATHGAAIAAAVSGTAQFVDLGAGDCAKAREWLPKVRPARYVPVDIAKAELESALAGLAPDFPDIEMLGVACDFTQGLPLDDLLDARPVTFFYPGSSIGNFTPGDSVEFLARLQRLGDSRPGSGLLIGVDAKKDPAVLEAAYDDALGVTAAFDLNLLRRLNRLLGADFDVRRWRHLARWDAAASRIEMHLESLEDQVVRWGDAARAFARGERIHTEDSYKWTPDGFDALLRDAGFGRIERWTDDRARFAVFAAGG